MVDISIYMTVYNASLYIEECIESALNQSFENFEFIIVDDGSIDDTVYKIEKFRNKKIKLFKNNHDYIQSLNLAIKQSNGKYLAKMDADDIMPKNRLLIQFNYLESHKKIDLIAGGMRLFGDSSGFYIPKITSEIISIKDMLENNIIAHPTVMIRKESLLKLPVLYEHEYIYAEDYKLWLTMLDFGLKLDNLPDVLNEHRISQQQISNTKRQKQVEITNKIKIIFQNSI